MENRLQTSEAAMDKKDMTTGILVGITTLLVVWDIYVATSAPTGSTISRVIRSYSKKYPMIPFAIGVLCGHVFWPLDKE